jgi:hypothetical protein
MIRLKTNDALRFKSQDMERVEKFIIFCSLDEEDGSSSSKEESSESSDNETVDFLGLANAQNDEAREHIYEPELRDNCAFSSHEI